MLKRCFRKNCKKTDGSVYVAEANAETVWVHCFTYNKQTQNHMLDSELVSIDTAFTEDPATKKVVLGDDL